jgi:hypothetical protein
MRESPSRTQSEGVRWLLTWGDGVAFRNPKEDRRWP